MLLKARTEGLPCAGIVAAVRALLQGVALAGGKERAETNMWEDIYCHWVDVCIHVSTHVNDHKLPEDYILSPASHSQDLGTQ